MRSRISVTCGLSTYGFALMLGGGSLILSDAAHAQAQGQEWPQVCLDAINSPKRVQQGTEEHATYGVCGAIRLICAFSLEVVSQTGAAKTAAMRACIARGMSGSTPATPQRQGKGEVGTRDLLVRCRGETQSTGAGAELELLIDACTSVIGTADAPRHAIAQAYAWRAMHYVNKKQYDLVIRDASAAIEMESTMPVAFLARAEAYGSLEPSDGLPDQYDRAMADATEAIRLKPQKDILAAALGLRGFLYRFHKADYQRAIDDLSQALRLWPDDADIYKERALAERALGRTAAAEADLRAAKVIDPNINE